VERSLACRDGYWLAWLEESQRSGWAREVQVPVQIGEVTGTADIVWPDCTSGTPNGRASTRIRKSFASRRSGSTSQVAGYAALLGKPKYALINWNLGQLGKGEKLDIIIDEQPTPKDAADKVLAIWDTVESHASLGELPPRGYPREKCTKLKCRFLSDCWGA
jgi:hypothetical protein